MPFGSEDHAFQNSSSLVYLSSKQALADYVRIITDVKKNLSAENCPAIAVGASYGGSKLISLNLIIIRKFCDQTYVFLFLFFLFSVLAAWFRLKYPHIVIGSLASSSPILYFDDITPQNGYHVVVTNDFKVRI